MELAREFGSRVARVRAEMERRRVDHVLIGPSSDMIYLIGYDVPQSDRMTVLVVSREGTPRLVTPDFDLPQVEGLAAPCEPVPWGDGEDPARRLRSLFPSLGSQATLAVGGQLFARFLFRIQAALPEARYSSADVVMDPVRMRKSENEVERLRTASRAADSVYGDLLELPLAGMSERELLAETCRLLAARGHDPATAGAIVAAGPNAASIGHVATDRRIAAGDPLLIDFGGTIAHYYSDMTRTIHIGDPSPEFAHLYDIVNQANERAFEAVRPGVKAEAVDAAARSWISEHGHGAEFVHRTGHGIGLDDHEVPYLGSGDATELEEGMVVSIEPGIYQPDKLGIRIEDIVVVTATGAERLNTASRSLQVLAAA